VIYMTSMSADGYIEADMLRGSR